MTISIRAATSFDANNLYQMIYDLAVYEREERSVKVTVSDLEQQLRQSVPPFHCLIAEIDGTPCGFALYFFTYSTWEGRQTLYLEDLYVSTKYRGRGIGLELMRKLAQIAVREKCSRFEWSVLNWNESAITFYDSLGAQPLGDWIRYRMNESAMTSLIDSTSQKTA